MKRFFCLGMVCVFICLCAGCDRQPPRSVETIFAMDTVMELQIEGEDASTALQMLKQLVSDVERDWSNTNEKSIIAKLNAGEYGLAPEDRVFLKKTEALSAWTNGAFDPKLDGIIRLWGFQSEDQCVPTSQQIDEARDSALWNLSAAIKGYTADLAVKCLEELNIDRAVLNLGGNVQSYGEKENGEPWVIGIQNPAGGGTLGTVSVVGTTAVVTSGDYQRYFEQDGVRYHHILDPKTGMPARSGLSSVTIVCQNGLTADALSTALFVMGLDAGIEFYRQNTDFEVIFITAEGDVFVTEGVAFSGCDYEVIQRED